MLKLFIICLRASCAISFVCQHNICILILTSDTLAKHLVYIFHNLSFLIVVRKNIIFCYIIFYFCLMEKCISWEYLIDSGQDSFWNILGLSESSSESWATFGCHAMLIIKYNEPCWVDDNDLLVLVGKWADPGGTAMPGQPVTRPEQAPEPHPLAKISLISKGAHGPRIRY